MRTESFSEQIQEFIRAGGAIQVIAPRQVRKSEKTFPAVRGSVSNAGHQAVAMKAMGYRSRRA